MMATKDVDYVAGRDTPKEHVPNPNELYDLARSVGELLTEVHNKYLGVFREAYSPDSFSADPLNTVVNGRKVKMRHALVKSERALNTAYGALTGAERALRGVWDEPNLTKLCEHCHEKPARTMGLCDTDYRWCVRHDGARRPL